MVLNFNLSLRDKLKSYDFSLREKVINADARYEFACANVISFAYAKRFGKR